MIQRRGRRKGMSLLEVIIALATFLMSVTGLVFLMGIASDNALEAQMRSQAQSICQSRLAEVSCGSLPLSGTGKAPCEDDEDFQWSMDVTPGTFGSLSIVTVTVSRKRANGTQFECSMSQMVLDPTVVGTVFDGAKDLQTPSTAGSSTPDASASASPMAPAASPKPSMSPKMGGAESGPKGGGSGSPKGGGTPTPTPSPKGGGTPAPTPSPSKTGG